MLILTLWMHLGIILNINHVFYRMFDPKVKGSVVPVEFKSGLENLGLFVTHDEIETFYK